MNERIRWERPVQIFLFSRVRVFKGQVTWPIYADNEHLIWNITREPSDI